MALRCRGTHRICAAVAAQILWVFSCRQIILLVLLHGRQDTKISLQASAIVIGDVFFNHLDKTFPGGKPSAIIALAFENTPKAFHWSVINAVRHAGHTLHHPGLFQLRMKNTVRILKASVTVIPNSG